MNKDTQFTIRTEKYSIRITPHCRDTHQLCEKLFCDLPDFNLLGSDSPTQKYLDLSRDTESNFVLFEDQKEVYRGGSEYDLAYDLINKVIYLAICDNHKHHAIHGGALHADGIGIILPGLSGKGKSTLTAYLCTKGYGYLTDELFFFSEEGQILPFTRPINFKRMQPLLSEECIARHKEEIILSDKGASMVPHRLFNPNFTRPEVTVSAVVFPEYKRGAPTEIQAISPAKSCLKLIQSHVNARNLPSHGFSSLSAIARGCQSCTLTYSSLDGLMKTLSSHLPKPD